MTIYYFQVLEGVRSDNSRTTVIMMTLSYKKLWHRLIDKDMTKTEIQKVAVQNWGTVAKLNRGENCQYFDSNAHLCCPRLRYFRNNGNSSRQ